MQPKLAKVKRPRKRKGNGMGNHQKKSKFWRMRMHQVEILLIVVPNVREINLLGKNSFFSKT